MQEIIFQLAVILLAAIFLGAATKKIGLSSLVGQIAAGVIVGPILGIVHENEILNFISLIGIIILVFLIGLETNFDSIKKDAYNGSFLAISGSFLTFICGLLLGELLFKDINIGIVLGIAMISTSTAIPLKLLIDRNEHKTRVGSIFTTMALADDIIAILALSVMVSYFTAKGLSIIYVISLFFAILGFIFITMTAGRKLIGHFLRFFTNISGEQIILSITLSIIFFLTFISDQIGLAAITGAFLVGMAMAGEQVNIIKQKIQFLGYGLFIPIFFAYSALFININSIFNSFNIIIILLIVGSLSKAIGSGYFSKFFGFSIRDQRIIAIGMIPRGEYGIVISQIALVNGIINNNIYSILLSFVVLTTLITPILFTLNDRLRERNY